MKHTVKKSKANRIAMRVTACVFMLIAVLRLLVVLMAKEHKSAIVTVLCMGCLFYGIYLFYQTLRAQAYDITYIFGDQTLTLQLHRKEIQLSYGEIRDIGYVVPNNSLNYSLVQIYIGKEQYGIPFMGNSEVGEALYGMLKLKMEEAVKSFSDTEEKNGSINETKKQEKE